MQLFSINIDHFDIVFVSFYNSKFLAYNTNKIYLKMIMYIYISCNFFQKIYFDWIFGFLDFRHPQLLPINRKKVKKNFCEICYDEFRCVNCTVNNCKRQKKKTWFRKKSSNHRGEKRKFYQKKFLKMSLLSLPDEILEHILTQNGFQARDITSVSSSCRRFREIIHRHSIYIMTVSS